jgi:hypothetical protein
MILEKPASYFHVRFARLLPKKIAVNLLIAVFKESRFSTIATLRHVVRETGYHHAGQARHERKLGVSGRSFGEFGSFGTDEQCVGEKLSRY